MRQLDAMLRQISKRRHNELAVQASFHGVKIPLIGESVEPVQTSPLEEKEALAMQKAIAEAKLRKSQEFAKRHGI